MDMQTFYHAFDALAATEGRDAVDAFLRQSLRQAEEENDKHALVGILNEMMGFLRNTSRYAEGLRTATRAVSLLQELGYRDTVPYGTTLLNCATLYRACGDNVNALETFIETLGIFSRHLAADDHRLAGLYNNIGAIYMETERYDQALDMLRQAEAILEKHADMESDAATVQCNLAVVLFRQNRDEQAREVLDRARTLLRRSEQAAGPGAKPGPQYAAALAEMGEACLRSGKYAEAVEAYESALTHLKEVFGENKDFAVTCHNCAVAYAAAGQPEKARELAAKADALLAEMGAEPVS